MCWMEPGQTAGKDYRYLFTQGQSVLNRCGFRSIRRVRPFVVLFVLLSVCASCCCLRLQRPVPLPGLPVHPHHVLGDRHGPRGLYGAHGEECPTCFMVFTEAASRLTC